jgi:hypothetical protein
MDYHSKWEAQQALALEAGKKFLGELQNRLIHDKVSPFTLHGYGSGDSPESTEYHLHGDDAPETNWEMSTHCWCVSQMSYNNEGGGWYLRWDGETLELTPYANVVENYDSVTFDDES